MKRTDQGAQGCDTVWSREQADERGQGLIEYGLLVAIVSIAALVLVEAIGGYVPHLFAIPLNAL